MATTSDVIERRALLRAGEWAASHSKGLIHVYSANTEQEIGSVPDADRDDVDAAVVAARAAFDDPRGWAHWEPAARVEALRRFATAIDDRAEAIARLVSDQNGMPIFLSTGGDSRRPGQLLRYYADMISAGPDGEEVRQRADGGRTMVRRVPLGVVAAVVVWTSDHARGVAVARRIVTGSVGINHFMPDLESPMTMIKASGIGVKFGPEALSSRRRYQVVYL
jgi:acyl-CoA reductase-like NAD-dependent aldehyde dehydrogenase